MRRVNWIAELDTGKDIALLLFEQYLKERGLRKSTDVSFDGFSGMMSSLFVKS
jgi:hypothetical protein